MAEQKQEKFSYPIKNLQFNLVSENIKPFITQAGLADKGHPLKDRTYFIKPEQDNIRFEEKINFCLFSKDSSGNILELRNLIGVRLHAHHTNHLIRLQTPKHLEAQKSIQLDDSKDPVSIVDAIKTRSDQQSAYQFITSTEYWNKTKAWDRCFTQGMFTLNAGVREYLLDRGFCTQQNMPGVNDKFILGFRKKDKDHVLTAYLYSLATGEYYDFPKEDISFDTEKRVLHLKNVELFLNGDLTLIANGQTETCNIGDLFAKIVQNNYSHLSGDPDWQSTKVDDVPVCVAYQSQKSPWFMKQPEATKFLTNLDSDSISLDNEDVITSIKFTLKNNSYVINYSCLCIDDSTIYPHKITLTYDNLKNQKSDAYKLLTCIVDKNGVSYAAYLEDEASYQQWLTDDDVLNTEEYFSDDEKNDNTNNNNENPKEEKGYAVSMTEAQTPAKSNNNRVNNDKSTINDSKNNIDVEAHGGLNTDNEKTINNNIEANNIDDDGEANNESDNNLFDDIDEEKSYAKKEEKTENDNDFIASPIEKSVQDIAPLQQNSALNHNNSNDKNNSKQREKNQSLNNIVEKNDLQQLMEMVKKECNFSISDDNLSLNSLKSLEAESEALHKGLKECPSEVFLTDLVFQVSDDGKQINMKFRCRQLTKKIRHSINFASLKDTPQKTLEFKHNLCNCIFFSNKKEYISLETYITNWAKEEGSYCVVNSPEFEKEKQEEIGRKKQEEIERKKQEERKREKIARKEEAERKRKEEAERKRKEKEERERKEEEERKRKEKEERERKEEEEKALKSDNDRGKDDANSNISVKIVTDFYKQCADYKLSSGQDSVNNNPELKTVQDNLKKIQKYLPGANNELFDCACWKNVTFLFSIKKQNNSIQIHIETETRDDITVPLSGSTLVVDSKNKCVTITLPSSIARLKFYQKTVQEYFLEKLKENFGDFTINFNITEQKEHLHINSQSFNVGASNNIPTIDKIDENKIDENSTITDVQNEEVKGDNNESFFAAFYIGEDGYKKCSEILSKYASQKKGTSFALMNTNWLESGFELEKPNVLYDGGTSSIMFVAKDGNKKLKTQTLVLSSTLSYNTTTKTATIYMPPELSGSVFGHAAGNAEYTVETSFREQLRERNIINVEFNSQEPRQYKKGAQAIKTETSSLLSTGIYDSRNSNRSMLPNQTPINDNTQTESSDNRTNEPSNEPLNTQNAPYSRSAESGYQLFKSQKKPFSPGPNFWFGLVTFLIALLELAAGLLWGLVPNLPFVPDFSPTLLAQIAPAAGALLALPLLVRGIYSALSISDGKGKKWLTRGVAIITGFLFVVSIALLVVKFATSLLPDFFNATFVGGLLAVNLVLCASAIGFAIGARKSPDNALRNSIHDSPSEVSNDRDKDKIEDGDDSLDLITDNLNSGDNHISKNIDNNPNYKNEDLKINDIHNKETNISIKYSTDIPAHTVKQPWEQVIRKCEKHVKNIKNIFQLNSTKLTFNSEASAYFRKSVLHTIYSTLLENKRYKEYVSMDTNGWLNFFKNIIDDEPSKKRGIWPIIFKCMKVCAHVEKQTYYQKVIQTLDTMCKKVKEELEQAKQIDPENNDLLNGMNYDALDSETDDNMDGDNDNGLLNEININNKDPINAKNTGSGMINDNDNNDNIDNIDIDNDDANNNINGRILIPNNEWHDIVQGQQSNLASIDTFLANDKIEQALPDASLELAKQLSLYNTFESLKDVAPDGNNFLLELENRLFDFLFRLREDPSETKNIWAYIFLMQGKEKLEDKQTLYNEIIKQAYKLLTEIHKKVQEKQGSMANLYVDLSNNNAIINKAYSSLDSNDNLLNGKNEDDEKEIDLLGNRNKNINENNNDRGNTIDNNTNNDDNLLNKVDTLKPAQEKQEKKSVNHRNNNHNRDVTKERDEKVIENQKQALTPDQQVAQIKQAAKIALKAYVDRLFARKLPAATFNRLITNQKFIQGGLHPYSVHDEKGLNKEALYRYYLMHLFHIVQLCDGKTLADNKTLQELQNDNFRQLTYEDCNAASNEILKQINQCLIDIASEVPDYQAFDDHSPADDDPFNAFSERCKNLLGIQALVKPKSKPDDFAINNVNLDNKEEEKVIDPPQPDGWEQTINTCAADNNYIKTALQQSESDLFAALLNQNSYIVELNEQTTLQKIFYASLGNAVLNQERALYVFLDKITARPDSNNSIWKEIFILESIAGNPTKQQHLYKTVIAQATALLGALQKKLIQQHNKQAPKHPIDAPNPANNNPAINISVNNNDNTPSDKISVYIDDFNNINNQGNTIDNNTNNDANLVKKLNLLKNDQKKQVIGNLELYLADQAIELNNKYNDITEKCIGDHACIMGIIYSNNHNLKAKLNAIMNEVLKNDKINDDDIDYDQNNNDSAISSVFNNKQQSHLASIDPSLADDKNDDFNEDIDDDDNDFNSSINDDDDPFDDINNNVLDNTDENNAKKLFESLTSIFETEGENLELTLFLSTLDDIKNYKKKIENINNSDSSIAKKALGLARQNVGNDNLKTEPEIDCINDTSSVPKDNKCEHDNLDNDINNLNKNEVKQNISAPLRLSDKQKQIIKELVKDIDPDIYSGVGANNTITNSACHLDSIEVSLILATALCVFSKDALSNDHLFELKKIHPAYLLTSDTDGKQYKKLPSFIGDNKTTFLEFLKTNKPTQTVQVIAKTESILTHQQSHYLVAVKKRETVTLCDSIVGNKSDDTRTQEARDIQKFAQTQGLNVQVSYLFPKQGYGQQAADCGISAAIKAAYLNTSDEALPPLKTTQWGEIATIVRDALQKVHDKKKEGAPWGACISPLVKCMETVFKYIKACNVDKTINASDNKNDVKMDDDKDESKDIKNQKLNRRILSLDKRREELLTFFKSTNLPFDHTEMTDTFQAIYAATAKPEVFTNSNPFKAYLVSLLGTSFIRNSRSWEHLYYNVYQRIKVLYKKLNYGVSNDIGFYYKMIRELEHLKNKLQQKLENNNLVTTENNNNNINIKNPSNAQKKGKTQHDYNLFINSLAKDRSNLAIELYNALSADSVKDLMSGQTFDVILRGLAKPNSTICQELLRLVTYELNSPPTEEQLSKCLNKHLHRDGDGASQKSAKNVAKINDDDIDMKDDEKSIDLNDKNGDEVAKLKSIQNMARKAAQDIHNKYKLNISCEAYLFEKFTKKDGLKTYSDDFKTTPYKMGWLFPSTLSSDTKHNHHDAHVLFHIIQRLIKRCEGKVLYIDTNDDMTYRQDYTDQKAIFKVVKAFIENDIKKLLNDYKISKIPVCFNNFLKKCCETLGMSAPKIEPCPSINNQYSFYRKQIVDPWKTHKEAAKGISEKFNRIEKQRIKNSTLWFTTYGWVGDMYYYMKTQKNLHKCNTLYEFICKLICTDLNLDDDSNVWNSYATIFISLHKNQSNISTFLDNEYLKLKGKLQDVNGKTLDKYTACSILQGALNKVLYDLDNKAIHENIPIL